MARFATLRPGRTHLTKQDRDAAETAARTARDAAAAIEETTTNVLLRFFAALSAPVGSAAFSLAIANGDAETAAETLALGELRTALVDYFGDAYLAAIDRAGTATAALSTYDLGYEARRADVVQTALNRTGRLVTEISNETRAAIRHVVAAAVERGDNPLVAARSIRPLVGLTSRHVAAVERVRATAISRGLDRKAADRLAARNASRLLRYRTENIARTEILWATNTGQYDYWRQLADAGLLDRTASLVVWVVSDDDRLCPQCAPLDGEVVGFEEPFRSDKLGRPGEELRDRPVPTVLERPPLHPSCRCTLSLQTV